MNRTHAYTFTASLFLVAAAGCRDDSTNNPTPPADFATANDLAMTGDDMSTPPADMASPGDLNGVDLQVPTTQAPTEFMVVRIGDGTAYAAGKSAPVFIEKHKISDGSLVGTAIALPTAVTGANKRLTLTSSTLLEGGLSLSGDGKYLLVGGYDADINTDAVVTATGVNRVIGRIDAAGTIDTSTSASYFTGQNMRSVTSTDGNDLWVSSATGIVYTTLGSAAAPTSLLTGNMRWLQVLGGQLYVTSGAGTVHGVATVGTGTPKTTATATVLPGMPTATSSPYGFVAFDTVAPAGIDVIYMSDDNSTTQGLQRWDLKGATWTLTGTLKNGLSGGVRGVTGFRSATSFTLIAVTTDVPPKIVSFTDDGKAMDQIPATTLLTAAANVVYRGISLPAK